MEYYKCEHKAPLLIFIRDKVYTIRLNLGCHDEEFHNAAPSKDEVGGAVTPGGKGVDFGGSRARTTPGLHSEVAQHP